MKRMSVEPNCVTIDGMKIPVRQENNIQYYQVVPGTWTTNLYYALKLKKDCDIK